MRPTRPLDEWLSTHDGISHTAEIKAAGYGQRAIAEAIHQGAAHRVRRSWIVLPTADVEVVAAVRAGGRLSCVSAASHKKLWVPEYEGIHVALKPTASRTGVADGFHLHWGVPPAPVGRFAVEDSIINVLFFVANCLSREEALAVWESAIRRKLVSIEVLRAVAWHSARASELLVAASLLSDSGLETIFVDRAAKCGVAVRQQVWIDGHPVDGLIGDRLVVQIDGFEHHKEAWRRRKDLADDARLVLRGYTVLRFDWKQVLFQWEFVEAAITTAMAQGLHMGQPVRSVS